MTTQAARLGLGRVGPLSLAMIAEAVGQMLRRKEDRG
jgi:hypothetical protein